MVLFFDATKTSITSFFRFTYFCNLFPSPNAEPCAGANLYLAHHIQSSRLTPTRFVYFVHYLA